MILKDLRDTQRDLTQLEEALTRGLALIPTNDRPQQTYEDNKSYNLWAKLLLSSLGDKNWWFMKSPLLHRSINQAWSELLPMYVQER